MENIMEENINKPKTKHPFIAGFWLITAIPISLLISFSLSKVVNMGTDYSDFTTFIFIFGVHFVSGYLWARALTLRTRSPQKILANIASGIGFGLLVVGGVQVWGGTAEWLIKLLSFKGVTHLEFGVFFVPWTGLVSGGTGLAYGLGTRNWKLALKLFWIGFLTGAGSFLVVAFLMDRIGFRVGTSRVDGLPSMPIVTLLGIWTAALVGSAVFGRILTRLNTELPVSTTNSLPMDISAVHQSEL